MSQSLAYIEFLPRLPLWLIGVLGVVALALLGWSVLVRAPGVLWRGLAFGVLFLALCNPRLLREERETHPDILLLVVDQSDSARLGERPARLAAARAALEARAARLPGLELRVVEVPEAGQHGTAL
ncbi:MAG: hypothetical protein RIS83_776, partial [Pseudomonadota bacterium]